MDFLSVVTDQQSNLLRSFALRSGMPVHELPEMPAELRTVAAGVGEGRKVGLLMAIEQSELGKGQCKHFLLLHTHFLFKTFEIGAKLCIHTGSSLPGCILREQYSKNF